MSRLLKLILQKNYKSIEDKEGGRGGHSTQCEEVVHDYTMWFMNVIMCLGLTHARSQGLERTLMWGVGARRRDRGGGQGTLMHPALESA